MSKSQQLVGTPYYPRAGVICKYNVYIEGEMILLQKKLRTIVALLCSYSKRDGIIYSSTPDYSEANVHRYKSPTGAVHTPLNADRTRRYSEISEGNFMYTTIEPHMFQRISHVEQFNTTLQEQVYLIRWYCQCIEALLTNFYEEGYDGYIHLEEILTREEKNDDPNYGFINDTCKMTVPSRRITTVKLTGTEDLF